MWPIAGWRARRCVGEERGVVDGLRSEEPTADRRPRSALVKTLNRSNPPHSPRILHHSLRLTIQPDPFPFQSSPLGATHTVYLALLGCRVPGS